MLSGNIGEWSEIYVFLKLLAEGRIDAADANLNKLKDIYYPILSILRREGSKNLEYKINSVIKVIAADTGQELLTLSIKSFVDKSIELFRALKAATGRSFSFSDIEHFLNSIQITSIKKSSEEKSDIHLIVHDLFTNTKPQLGFSIKSMLGGSSTLFNPGKTTNFIYEVIGRNIPINEINSIQDSPMIINRINQIRNLGYGLKFSKIQSDILQKNLVLIDGHLPKILSEMLLIKFSSSNNSLVTSLTNELNSKNPLKYDLSNAHPFYEYKIKNFLTDSALGMTPAKIWKGRYDATGGIIIVKKDGDIVCYHIYNRSEFQDYLFNNTKFEQAASGRYDYGYLYEESGKTFFKLNLQIRFNN